MDYSQKKNNRRVLVVDDEIDVLDFLNIYITSLGWEVTTASNMNDAFAELGKNEFFLVITDIAMPEMDGHEFISKLHEKNVSSEIALMTGFGYNPKHTLIKIQKTIKYPCLFKPFNRVKVAETIQAAWEKYHGTAPAM
jgi:two-component system, sensor histidine kinase SagS